MTFATNLVTLGRRVVGVLANNLVALDANAKLPAVDGSQLTNLPSLGAGQTLHDVTTSRVSGTQYQNTTGKDLLVIIYAVAVSNSGITIYADSTPVNTTTRVATTISTGNSGTAFAIVKPGEYYSLAGSLTKWWEYRI